MSIPLPLFPVTLNVSSRTGNKNDANDDSEIEEDISYNQTGARAEDEEEDDEEMPMRKRQRAGSRSASDAEEGRYEREVDADRNDRELRQDEEDDRKAEEPDENDEALGMSCQKALRDPV